MAKLEEYAHPDFGVDYDNVPQGFDWAEHWNDEQAALKELSDDGLKSKTLKGFVWSYQVADGYANYLVTKLRPLTLQFISFGDSYQVSDAHIRGLNAADLQQAKDWELKWRSLSNA
jgi:hypothetical protein